MGYLYIDESGDLGFDCQDKNPSKFFTICILIIKQPESYKKIRKVVKKTLHRKLNKPKKLRIYELKGSRTSIGIKNYFWKEVEDCDFGLYAVTLNKKQVSGIMKQNKERMYNFIARQVIDRIPFEEDPARIQIVIDKSKGKREIVNFNNYIFRHLEGRINPKTPINIDHISSHEDFVLQAVDLFTWGISRKYEINSREWYNIFKAKVLCDDQYL